MNYNKKICIDTALLLNIFIIALVIFIFGVQLGIKHGRELQLDEIRVNCDYDISNQKNTHIKKFAWYG